MPNFIRRQLLSFGYAFKGLRTAFETEQNFKIQIAAAFAVVAAGVWFKITPVEWALAMFATGLVMIAELFNTAVELITDHVQPEHHPLAGQVKDVAAAAVLVAFITACIIGVIVFGKYLAITFIA
jgi:diacylglycerol kinase (ATP)